MNKLVDDLTRDGRAGLALWVGLTRKASRADGSTELPLGWRRRLLSGEPPSGPHFPRHTHTGSLVPVVPTHGPQPPDVPSARGTFCMARDQQVEHVLALKLWVHFPGWRFRFASWGWFGVVLFGLFCFL